MNQKKISFFYTQFTGWDLALISLIGLLMVFNFQTSWIILFLFFLFVFHRSPLLFVIALANIWAFNRRPVEGSLIFDSLPGILAFDFSLGLAVFFTGFFLFLYGFSFACFYLVKKKGFLPKISPTEKSVLLAGKSGIERGFFTGRPDFKSLFAIEPARLSPREDDFLNRQTGELCSLSKEWELIQRRKLSQKTEDFLKQKKFFGLVIPQKYQGLGFSALAHAKVIEKIASDNIPLSVITMVPNSLGPAKLILKYGSKEQKDKYLPRLARGEELPCFGLTEEQAGSDASSLLSEGILFKENGILKIRLNWSKRWITLSPKASLIGLAVRLKDPERLVSDRKSLGIACLLVPSSAPGVERGLYHDPMRLPIYNAPVRGENVILPAEESLIGGLKNADKGWTMLMETLSEGRSISLPALALGSSKRVAWLTGAYALVRKQFGRSVGKFEGVEEGLASIAGLTHLMSAVQAFTLSGENSPVVSAITKYNLTEMARTVASKGMDIMAGAGLSLGPRNKIAHLYTFLPLAITVEGSNILTRTFIVYGQGLIKSHPYIYKMIVALEQNSFKDFHQNFWKLIEQFLCNGIRLFVFSLTGALTVIVPGSSLKKIRFAQKMEWASALFAFLSDLSFFTFAHRLRTKGRLTGRLADLLSYQYMAFTLLWQEKKTAPKDRPISLESQWGLEYCFAKMQEAGTAILRDYPHRVIRRLLWPLFFLLRVRPLGSPPSDLLGKKLAGFLMEDREFRAGLCSNMYFSEDPNDPLQKWDKAHELTLREGPILKKIRLAEKETLSQERNLKKEAHKGAEKPSSGLSPEEALKRKVISSEEYDILKSAFLAQKEAIKVDTFTEKEYFDG